MIIIVIEGLSLVGKTTLCANLVQYYTNKGKVCRFCQHGHLATNSKAITYYHQAISAYNSWQFKKALDYSIKSLQADYSDFYSNSGDNQDVDIIFLDRHFTSQYVVAEYFGIDIEIDFQKPTHYFEFLLTTNYPELLRRSTIRNDNHSKLTDYTLSNFHTYEVFEYLYKKYILQCNPSEHIIKNDDFRAAESLIPLINKFI